MLSRLERCRLPALMATGLAPLPALLGCACGVPALMLWPAAVLIFGSVCAFLGRRRLTVALVLCAATAAVGGAWYARQSEPAVLLIPLAVCAVLLAMLPHLTGRSMTNPGWIAAGLVVHVLAQLYLNLTEGSDVAARLAPARVMIALSLTAWLALALDSLNRISLNAAAPDASRVPAVIRRGNRALVWLMLAFTLAISLIPALGRWLNAAWEWLRRAVAALAAWIAGLLAFESAGRTAADSAPPEMLSGLPAGESSPLALWLEKLLLVVAVAAAVALAVLALRALWKQLRRLARMLLERWQQFAASAAEDYVDEVADTRSQGEETLLRGRRRRSLRRSLAGLPPREQIRCRYALLRAEHPEWAASASARDTLPAASAEIYERARYSTHDVTGDDAEKFLH